MSLACFLFLLVNGQRDLRSEEGKNGGGGEELLQKGAKFLLWKRDAFFLNTKTLKRFSSSAFWLLYTLIHTQVVEVGVLEETLLSSLWWERPRWLAS